jgi:hypothetical protein
MICLSIISNLQLNAVMVLEMMAQAQGLLLPLLQGSD